MANINITTNLVDSVDTDELKYNSEIIQRIPYPEYTTVERDALTPIKGLTIYNTTDSQFQIYNGSTWESISSSGLVDLSTHSVTELNDVSNAGSGIIMTDIERTKLDGIEENAQVNVQSDWEATSGDELILNKPDLSNLHVQNTDYQIYTVGTSSLLEENAVDTSQVRSSRDRVTEFQFTSDTFISTIRMKTKQTTLYEQNATLRMIIIEGGLADDDTIYDLTNGYDPVIGSESNYNTISKVIDFDVSVPQSTSGSPIYDIDIPVEYTFKSGQRYSVMFYQHPGGTNDIAFNLNTDTLSFYQKYWGVSGYSNSYSKVYSTTGDVTFYFGFNVADVSKVETTETEGVQVIGDLYFNNRVYGNSPSTDSELTTKLYVDDLVSSSTFDTSTVTIFDDVINAGSGSIITTSERNKLAGIDAGAEVNVDTDLSRILGVDSVTINSSTGTGTVIPAATTSAAGVMSKDDKISLHTQDTDTQITNSGTTLSVDSDSADLNARLNITPPLDSIGYGHYGDGALKMYTYVDASGNAQLLLKDSANDQLVRLTSSGTSYLNGGGLNVNGGNLRVDNDRLIVGDSTESLSSKLVVKSGSGDTATIATFQSDRGDSGTGGLEIQQATSRTPNTFIMGYDRVNSAYSDIGFATDDGDPGMVFGTDQSLSVAGTTTVDKLVVNDMGNTTTHGIVMNRPGYSDYWRISMAYGEYNLASDSRNSIITADPNTGCVAIDSRPTSYRLYANGQIRADGMISGTSSIRAYTQSIGLAHMTPGGNTIINTYTDSSDNGRLYMRDGNSDVQVYLSSVGDSRFYHTDGVSLQSQTATLNLGNGGNTGPHTINFYDSNDTIGLRFAYRTTPEELSIQNSSSTELIVFDKSGNITANDFILSSDIRLKENIQPLNNYTNINSFNFKKDKNKRKRYGVIAQELEKTNPELVQTKKDGYKTVSYTDYLLMRMAEKDEQIERLNERLLKLENK